MEGLTREMGAKSGGGAPPLHSCAFCDSVPSPSPLSSFVPGCPVHGCTHYLQGVPPSSMWRGPPGGGDGGGAAGWHTSSVGRGEETCLGGEESFATGLPSPCVGTCKQKVAVWGSGPGQSQGPPPKAGNATVLLSLPPLHVSKQSGLKSPSCPAPSHPRALCQDGNLYMLRDALALLRRGCTGHRSLTFGFLMDQCQVDWHLPSSTQRLWQPHPLVYC